VVLLYSIMHKGEILENLCVMKILVFFPGGGLFWATLCHVYLADLSLQMMASWLKGLLLHDSLKIELYNQYWRFVNSVLTCLPPVNAASNTFSRVCLCLCECVCVCPVCASASLDLETSVTVCRYVFRIYTSDLYSNVIGSSSRSQDQKRSYKCY